VILAADQQVHSPEEIEVTPGNMMRKIVIHDDFPLAIAIGGYAKIPIPRLDYMYVTDFISKVFEMINKNYEPDRVFRLLVKCLFPYVREMRKIGRDSGYEPKSIVLYGAMIVNGLPVLKTTTIKDDDPVIEIIPGAINAPTHLLEFYRELKQSESDFFGKLCLTIPSHARHARAIINSGVDFETLIRKNLPPTVGGQIDVVIVDKIGCIFI
jgi:hypothetical protein